MSAPFGEGCANSSIWINDIRSTCKCIYKTIEGENHKVKCVPGWTVWQFRGIGLIKIYPDQSTGRTGKCKSDNKTKTALHWKGENFACTWAGLSAEQLQIYVSFVISRFCPTLIVSPPS